MKKVVMFLVIALAFALPAGAADQPKLGKQRWQNLAGWASVDSLNWSDQGAYSLQDTIVSTTADTTTSEVDITGCSYASVFIIARKNGTCAYQHVRYTPQISPDLNTWISYAGVFSTITTSSVNDTVVCVLYDASSAKDTTFSTTTSVGNIKQVGGRDSRLFKSGKYLRLVATPTGGAATDSVKVISILVRQWPAADVQ